MKLSFLTAVLIHTIRANDDTTESLYSSCVGLEDGEYYLKLIDEDNYPIIKAKCSNEYLIIDHSYDSDISQYFSSWVGWHYALSGPLKSDTVNWGEWYLPDGGKSNTQYLLSPDCSTCDATDSLQQYTTSTTYYMNANMFGCFGFGRGFPTCDWDWNTYECTACIRDEFNEKIDRIFTHVDPGTKGSVTGQCGLNIQSAHRTVATTYYDCTGTTGSYKPSIGTSGQYCICTKPKGLKNTNFNPKYDVPSSLLKSKQESQPTSNSDNEKIDENVSDQDSKQTSPHVYNLYQSDFNNGTYRIKSSGYYKIMEDIVFNFKSNYNNPNSEGAWFPTIDQIDEYPGAGQSRDAYYYGFFAGITIEADNVILDLNGYELKQSLAFMTQQGFFSIIEVGSQPFLPGQGIGFFGADPKLPNNVVIKNGILGLSSHHGIHGNYNKNVVVENVKIKDFGTHGIQFNGFDNLVLRDIEIGPSTQDAWMTAPYTHGRAFLATALKIAAENDATVPLSNREEPVTMSQIAEELNEQLDMAFNYIVNNVDYDTLYQNDEEKLLIWHKAKDVFIKDDGIPYGSSMYGIFLNYPGSSILSYHLNNDISHKATLENIYIHDMTHRTVETLALKTTKRTFANPVDAPIEAKHVFGTNELTEDLLDGDTPYDGNIMTDLYFAMYYLTENWDYLGLMYMGDDLHNWAFGQASISEAADSYMCNGDSMIHSLKGVVGLRIDGVEDVTVSNLKIENLLESAELGSELCGEYDHSHFTQRLPFQVGYSGNMMQAISVDYSNVIFKDITINNIESTTGMAVGINLWYGADIEFDNSISINGIYAGSKLNDNDKATMSYDDRPNKSPESCFVRVVDLLDEDVEIKQNVKLTMNGISKDLIEMDSVNIDGVFDLQCIEGVVGCNGEILSEVKSNIGGYDGCEKVVNRDKIEEEGDNDVSYLSLGMVMYKVVNDGKMDDWVIVAALGVIVVGVMSMMKRAGCFNRNCKICKKRREIGIESELIDNKDDRNDLVDRDNHYGSMIF